MVKSDTYNLMRFVKAQDPVFNQVCKELRQGGKEGHWMWFVFPQLVGLGSSPTAQRFAISSLLEAEAYLTHSILGPRLRKCTRLVNCIEDGSVEQIFSYPDNLKFHSCMTLFVQIARDTGVFHDALEKYFKGKQDRRTLELLRGPSN